MKKRIQRSKKQITGVRAETIRRTVPPPSVTQVEQTPIKMGQRTRNIELVRQSNPITIPR